MKNDGSTTPLDPQQQKCEKCMGLDEHLWSQIKTKMRNTSDRSALQSKASPSCEAEQKTTRPQHLGDDDDLGGGFKYF